MIPKEIEDVVLDEPGQSGELALQADSTAIKAEPQAIGPGPMATKKTKKTAKAASKAPAKKAFKKKAPKAELAYGAKAEFIRRNPKLTAVELVAKAKGEGIALTSQYVYVQRSKKGARSEKKSSAKATKVTRAHVSGGHTLNGAHSLAAERDIRNIFYRYGATAVETVLADVKRSME